MLIIPIEVYTERDSKPVLLNFQPKFLLFLKIHVLFFCGLVQPVGKKLDLLKKEFRKFQLLGGIHKISSNS